MRRNTADKKRGKIPEQKPVLPLTVTTIKPQRKRSDRFSLFNGQDFIIGVSTETLARFKLDAGMVITAGLYEKIVESEEVRSCRDYLLRMLGSRDHGANEIRLKAIRKGYNEKYIDPLIDEFQNKGYLDDEEFACKFAADKLHLKRWGPQKIKAKLAEKGIDYNITEKVVNNLTEDLELSQICVDLILKRIGHFTRESDEFKRKQKIAAYLQQKGFPFETINRALPEIISRLNV